MALRKRLTSSADTSGGSMRSVGSPVRWRMTKTTTEIPRSTIRAWASRRAT
jgi:hypothetical protein